MHNKFKKAHASAIKQYQNPAKRRAGKSQSTDIIDSVNNTSDRYLVNLGIDTTLQNKFEDAMKEIL
jgi:cation transport regulator ChaB